MSFFDKAHYTTWEYTYFRYLVEMFRIFQKHLEPMLSVEDDVFPLFCRLIYHRSSKHITLHIDPLDDEWLYAYLNYKYYVTNEC